MYKNNLKILLSKIKERQEIRQQTQVCEVCGHCLDPGERSPQNQLMLIEMVEYLTRFMFTDAGSGAMQTMREHAESRAQAERNVQKFKELEKIVEKYK